MNIGFNEAKQFLDDLKPTDNVCLIFHDDLDGLASGVLLYDWCKMKGIEKPKIKIFCSEYFIGDLHKGCNKIIVADVFPSGFKMLAFSKDQKVLYLDHHLPLDKLSPLNVLEYRTVDDGMIPSSRTVQELTGLKRWMGICGVLGDAGELYPENNDYINSFLEEKGITLGEFKVGVSNVITNCITYFKDDLLQLFDILRRKDNPEDCDDLRNYSDVIEEAVQKELIYYKEKMVKLGKVNYCFLNPKYKVERTVIGLVSRELPNEIFLMIKPSSAEGRYSLSMRAQRDDINLNDFIRKAMEGIEDSSAGGHKRAVGGSFNIEDLSKVKKRIEDLSLEMFK